MVASHRPTVDEIRWWADRDGYVSTPVTVSDAPGENIEPCPALIYPPAATTHVGYELTPDEIEALGAGGRLWLTTWGPFPIHRLEIVPAAPSIDGIDTGDPLASVLADATPVVSGSRMLSDLLAWLDGFAEHNPPDSAHRIGVAAPGFALDQANDQGVDVLGALDARAQQLGYAGVKIERSS